MIEYAKTRKIKKPKSVSELVLEQLRADIIQNRFSLDEKISEAQISELYGVTKAPVRSAYIHLEIEGLLEVRPQSGTYVFKPSTEELRALCELRIALELEAMSMAIKRDGKALSDELGKITDQMQSALKKNNRNRYQQLDGEFHMAIVSRAKSPILAETYDARVHSLISALRYRFSLNKQHNDKSIGEHVELQSIIESGDSDSARALLRSHIGYSESYYESLTNPE